MVLNKRKRREKIDRISELPDCLLHQIFSFVSITDAVKTCILSKRWRYLWTSLPFLNLSFTISYSDTFIINFINQLLLRRNAVPINSFIYLLDFPVEASVVESWICYAVKHHVQHLEIATCSEMMGMPFPFYFCGCASLITLTLDLTCFGRTLLPKPTLKNLHLTGLQDCDGSIFSSCPNLETLELEDVCLKGIGNFSVCAPNLKSFDVVNYPEEYSFSHCEFVIVAPKLRKFKFYGYPPKVFSPKNLYSLDQIEFDLPDSYELDSISYTDELKQEYARQVLQMLNAFHIAKSIKLTMNVMWALSHIPSLLNERPSQFPNMKSLKVKTHKFSKNVKIPSFILDYFLKDSSLLEICQQ